ncbi:MAG: hypothetical protein U1F43_19385 [Myxococcota bacterium]
MARSWQDDLAASMSAEGALRGLPVHAKRRARFVRAVVEAATARGPDAGAITAVRCIAPTPTGGGDCGDWIHVARDGDRALAWSCPGCGEHGFVSGYARGPYDLRAHPAEPSPLRWAPSDDELALLDDATDLRPDLRAVLARAVPTELGVVVPASRAELDRVYAFVASLVDASLSANRMELLDSLRAGLSAALEPRSA